MVGHRVEDLVKGWIQRSYLERDGWWAQLVLDEFAFLDELGFSLVASSWAGVHFHQKGHYVGFVGPRRDIAVDYDPDDPKRVTIGASLVEHDPPRFVSLDEVLAEHIPGVEMPRRKPLDRDAVEANVRWWADGLRQIAPEVL